MKCSHLTGKKVQTCTESKQKYVPSLFELEEYCHTAKSARCPLLIGSTWGDQYTAQAGERAGCQLNDEHLCIKQTRADAMPQLSASFFCCEKVNCAQ